MKKSKKEQKSFGTLITKIKQIIQKYPKQTEAISIIILITLNIIFENKILSVTSIMLMWYAILRLRVLIDKNKIKDEGKFLW